MDCSISALVCAGLCFPATVTVIARALIFLLHHSTSHFLAHSSLLCPAPPAFCLLPTAPRRLGEGGRRDQASCLRMRVDGPSSLNLQFSPSLLGSGSLCCPRLLPRLQLEGLGSGKACTDPDFSLSVRASDQAGREEGTVEI